MGKYDWVSTLGNAWVSKFLGMTEIRRDGGKQGGVYGRIAGKIFGSDEELGLGERRVYSLVREREFVGRDIHYDDRVGGPLGVRRGF